MESSARSDMPTRILGRTGERVSAIGLGGWHLGLPHVDEALSLRIVRTAIDRGITFMDNSWDYNDGAERAPHGQGAARRLPASSVFLMTKIDGRSQQGGRRGSSTSRCAGCRPTASTWCSITRSSASRTRTASSTRTAPTPRSSRRAQAGKLRYIGFTGHKDPRIHLHMLEVAREHGFDFDAVQMPLNVMDAHYRSFEKLVLPELVKQTDRRARHEAAWRTGSSCSRAP